MDKICFIYIPTGNGGSMNAPDFDYIENNCERNNILQVLYVESLRLNYLSSAYCRADRNVNIIESEIKDKYFFDCVLYDNKPRDIIPRPK